ncbi:PhoPQ-activated protein PqaA family protein [Martelella sp. HB161492]|uniref:PhoPQ-activated protein PqaA family protein n=1 Tax=Martelella sp. HB161492 TaxID=2720726 RepID=UPI001591C38F
MLAEQPKPLAQLFDFIDNTVGAAGTYSNCESVNTLATALSETYLCDFVAQTSWYNTASDFISADSGGGAWTQKVIVTKPSNFGGGSSEYLYLGAGGTEDAEFYYALFHDLLAEIITLPSYGMQPQDIDAVLTSGCRITSTDVNCVTANLASLISASTNVPIIVQLDIPVEPVEIKSPIDGNYYLRSEDDLIAESIMYPGKHLDQINEYMDYVTLFPMASSLVHGMEAGMASVGQISDLAHFPRATNYVLAGASKRGWALYLALMYDLTHDQMSKAAIPMVMPFDLQPVLSSISANFYFPSEYHGWSHDLQPYERDKKYNTSDRNLLDVISSGSFAAWEAQVDIAPYLRQSSGILNGFPILEVAATHDDYFTPIAPAYVMEDFWIGGFDPYASLVQMPNVGHGRIDPKDYPSLIEPAFAILGFVIDATGISGNIFNYTPESQYANNFMSQLMWQSAGQSFLIKTTQLPLIQDDGAAVYYRCAYANNKTDLLIYPYQSGDPIRYSDKAYFSDVEFVPDGFFFWRWNPSFSWIVERMQGCNGDPSSAYLGFFLGVIYPGEHPPALVSKHYRESPVYIINNPN